MKSKPPLIKLIGIILIIPLLITGCPPNNQESSELQETTIVFQFSHTSSDFHSVAFINGVFIDLYANPLGTIQDAILSVDGPGWLDHCTILGKNCRWAGGENRTASLNVQIPIHTEGLFLTVRGATTNQQLTVQVGNDDPVILLLDTQLQTKYVPIGKPIQEIAPDAAPIWDEEKYFPEFPPPSGRIYSFKIHTALEDWWGAPSTMDWRINQDSDTMDALTLSSMQGIINRSGPRVYLDWVGDGPRKDILHYWVNVLDDYTDIKELPLESRSAINFLWRRFGNRFSGAVIYDPNIPDTINIATMLSGEGDYLILSPEQLNTPGIPVFDESSIIDLRNLEQHYGWDNTDEGRLKLYQWVYDYSWNNPLKGMYPLDNRIVGVISPGPPTSILYESPIVDENGVPTYVQYDPLILAPRDYYVALRLPALWISPSISPASDLFRRFLQDAPAPIPVTAFYSIDESGTVSLLSNYGDWIPVIPNNNAPLSAGNLTVFSGIRPDVVRYDATINPEHIIASLGDIPVVSVILSDGDNIHYQLDHGFQTPAHLAWEDLQGKPFGWSINPILAELAPAVWNDYISNAGRTSFITGVSGAGYIYPELMEQQDLDHYLIRTANYLELTGIRTVLVATKYGQVGEFNNRLANQYYENLSENHDLLQSGVLGLVITYPHQIDNPLPVDFFSTPLPVVYPSYRLHQQGQGAQFAQELLNRSSGNIIHEFSINDGWLQCGNEFFDDFASGDITIKLNRSDIGDCIGTVIGPRMTLTPGSYTLTYRLKVTDNSSQSDIAHVLVLQQNSDGSNIFSDIWITPNSFTNADQYQNFSITFSLTDFTPNIQLWMDYTGGLTGSANSDLYLDTATLTSNSDDAFPQFVLVYVHQSGHSDIMTNDLEAITVGYEEIGGVLLSPDEFMAALNPEFMIEFAIPYLGEDSPSILEAKNQLQTGHYFESLSIIREALKTHFFY